MDILEKIKTDDDVVIGALMAIPMEGLHEMDSPILSEIAASYHEKKFLSGDQIAFVRRILLRYPKELAALDLSPITPPVKTNLLKRAMLNDKGNKIILRFRFPHGDVRFQETVSFVKTIRFCHFDPADRSWTAPFSLEAIQLLMNDGWHIEDRLLERFHHSTKEISTKKHFEIPGLRGIPRPFQYEGISFIDEAGGKAIIGDEMGLGKTIQALGWLQLHPEARPAIVICPATIKEDWAEKGREWLVKGANIRVLYGRPNSNFSPLQDEILILNYDILANQSGKDPKDPKKKTEIRNTGWGDALLKSGVKVVIADEFHNIKTNSALRTKAFKRLCKKAEYVIGLSGTPIEKKPSEFWNILHIISPDIFNDWVKFVTDFCGGKIGKYGWEFDNDAAKGKELNALIAKNIMIRRLKKDVLPELPPKQRNVVVLPMSPEGSRTYKEAEKAIATFDPKEPVTNQMARVERAKQMAVAAKLSSAIDWISNFLDNGNKLVLFIEHQNVADYIEKEFKKICVRVTGNSKDRKAKADAFQNDDRVRLFIGSKAAKEGLTLTAAADTAFLEFWWNPSWHDQAEDRVHRMTQEAESINAWYLVAADTCEEDIFVILDDKRKLLANTVDGREVEDHEMVTKLLERMKRKIKK